MKLLEHELSQEGVNYYGNVNDVIFSTPDSPLSSTSNTIQSPHMRVAMTKSSDVTRKWIMEALHCLHNTTRQKFVQKILQAQDESAGDEFAASFSVFERAERVVQLDQLLCEAAMKTENDDALHDVLSVLSGK